MGDKITLQENVPLAPYTTFRIGGPARFFVRATRDEEVVAAERFARERDLALFVLGGGSNILVSDEGFQGLVLHIASTGVTLHRGSVGQSDGRITVTARAGEDWDGFVAFCVERSLAGVECMSGIPGSVGGTPVQNVGAYGQEVSESIVSVRCLDRRLGSIVELSNRECGFSYRRSIFNSTERGRYIVLSVAYSLVEGGAPKISYKDLVEHFEGQTPTLAETREAVIAIRSAKSMVIREGDANSRSAGSFFKNPVVPRGMLEKIADAAGVDAAPHFAAGGEAVKIPAAWLIEKAGFAKGFRLGSAAISSNHSLALTNCGGAKAAEILALRDSIAGTVREKFGIRLEMEPIMVGFGADD